MAFIPYHFDCPHCGHKQTVTESNHFQSNEKIWIGKLDDGDLGTIISAIGCANIECKKLTLHFSVYPYHYKNDAWRPNYDRDPIFQRRILPESSAKPQPDYIPAAILEDYLEACKIRDLSPKASATLSRRCIQGMINDFAGVTSNSLYNQIKKLRDLIDSGSAPKGVSEESVDAIDGVRQIGNIGAHMEKDINQIIPVDANEAQILIDLTELLFEDWYIARHNRQMRLSRVKMLTEAKIEAKGKPIENS